MDDATLRNLLATANVEISQKSAQGRLNLPRQVLESTQTSETLARMSLYHLQIFLATPIFAKDVVCSLSNESCNSLLRDLRQLLRSRLTRVTNRSSVLDAEAYLSVIRKKEKGNQ